MEQIRRNKNFRFASIAVLLLSILSSKTLVAQCGRTQWVQVHYSYFSDYADHPRSTDVRVVRVTSSGSAANEITVAAQHQVPEPRNDKQTAITTNGGKTWVLTTDEIPSNIGIVPSWFVQSPSDMNFQYRFVEGLDLYLRSDDHGQSWILPTYFFDGKPAETFAQEIGGSRSHHVQIFLDAIHPKQPGTLYASIKVTPWMHPSEKLTWKNVRFIYQSIDGGEHWTQFNGQLKGFPHSLGGGSPIGINPNNPNIYFGIGEAGLVKSSDAGKTWHTVGQNEELEKRPLYSSERDGAPRMLGAPGDIEVYQFAFDPHQSEITYIVANKGLFRSEDEGHSWRLLDLGFDEINSVNSIGVNPTNGKQLYIGTRYGVFRSDDSGCSFQKIYPQSRKKPTH